MPALKTAATSQGEEIPPGLEYLSELKDSSPLQQLAACFPKFAEALKTDKAQEATECFAGWFWGAGFDLGVELPEWVKSASVKYWEAAGLNFTELKKGNSKDIGALVGLAENAPPSISPSKPEQAAQNLIKHIKTESGDFSATELKKYADARANALKMIQRIAEPPQRVKVFLTIACAWRQVEKMESAGEFHRWLVTHDLIAGGTDAAETRAVCRIIGFNPHGAAGRPPKKE